MFLSIRPRAKAARPTPAATDPKADGASGATLSTEDWIRQARAMLIAEGIGALKIDRLAKACKVTRGGFYWRFRNREDLLDRLLDHWHESNGTAYLDVLRPDVAPPARYMRLVQLLIDESRFDPAFDSAVRAWGAVSTKARALVHKADDDRIGALTRLFLDAGYAQEESFIRARIAYFHQVGYYALGVREARTTRLNYMPTYFRILTGFDDDIAESIDALRA
jgi:AcrR family transcriptional regulator